MEQLEFYRWYQAQQYNQGSAINCILLNKDFIKRQKEYKQNV